MRSAHSRALYTLIELGAAPRARVIGAIRELLVGATDAERAFARLTARDTRIVSLTVTEKGYCLDARNSLDRNERGHRPRPRESAIFERSGTTQHHRLDRRSAAPPPRAGHPALHRVELRQPAGQRCGAASRAGRRSRARPTPISPAGSKRKSFARARWSTASRRRPTMRCASARSRSRASSTNGPSSASRSRSG